jgi:hypothetical protein
LVFFLFVANHRLVIASTTAADRQIDSLRLRYYSLLFSNYYTVIRLPPPAAPSLVPPCVAFFYVWHPSRSTKTFLPAAAAAGFPPFFCCSKTALLFLSDMVFNFTGKKNTFFLLFPFFVDPCG